ncbi:hypothetical protein JW872_00715 [Candidatus Babeliales bacterium]|nr:hypothetical protein [Candidatus Babeliales bacterium]
MRKKNFVYLAFLSCLGNCIIMATENTPRVAPEASDSQVVEQLTGALRDGAFLTKLFWAAMLVWAAHLIGKQASVLLEPHNHTKEICSSCHQRVPGLILLHQCRHGHNNYIAYSRTRLPRGDVVSVISCKPQSNFDPETIKEFVAQYDKIACPTD